MTGWPQLLSEEGLELAVDTESQWLMNFKPIQRQTKFWKNMHFCEVSSVEEIISSLELEF